MGLSQYQKKFEIQGGIDHGAKQASHAQGEKAQGRHLCRQVQGKDPTERDGERPRCYLAGSPDGHQGQAGRFLPKWKARLALQHALRSEQFRRERHHSITHTEA